MRFAFSSLVALATAALAVAQPPGKPLPLNPDPSVAHPIVERGAPVPTGSQTNAKRFAAGLPPLSPRVYRRGSHRGHKGGHHGGKGGKGGEGGEEGTKVGAFSAAASPLPPASVKCNVLVKHANDGSTFGFIRPTWNVFGEYGAVQPDQAGSLQVSFTYSPDSPDTLSKLDFVADNGPSASFPYVGATVGYSSPTDDFAVGLFSYAYITGTHQLPPGPPSAGDNNSFGAATSIPKSAESAIWKYDPSTQAITAQWVNTDSSLPPSNLVYANDDNQAFLLTGDVATLQSTFGLPYPPITFTCVPPQAAPIP